jgi:hypothetical protein
MKKFLFGNKMATKYGPRKKHNAGTVRTSTNNQGGSRTRKTTTVKTGNYTRSRSVNRNGTVRLTTTHKSPSGFITRAVSTVGSKPSKPKAPKFIKAKPFKAPKMRSFKSPKIRSSSGSSFGFGSLFSGFSSGKSRRSRSVDVEEYIEDGETTTLNWWQWILLIIASPFLWLLNLLWPLIAAALYYSAIFIGLTLLAIVLLLMMGH